MLSVMMTEPSATSQGANKTFPWKSSILPKRKDSWMARKYVKQFSPPCPPCKIFSEMSECTKETESNSATSSTINSYSTFKKKLSQ